jgi:CubicO group peptidase (beta-lactamase class C family)
VKTFGRLSLWFGAVLGLILALGYLTPWGAFAINGPSVGAGVAAQLACAGVFVSDRSLDDVVQQDILRLSPLTKWNRYDLDRKAMTVSVTALGLSTRTSLYRPGIGCTLLVDDTPEPLRAQAKDIPTGAPALRARPWPQGDTVDLTSLPEGIARATLDRAVAESFTDETKGKEIDTRAILVVHDGRIVAERYAPGFNKDTRFLGWSASKSVTAALIGTLIADGKLAMDAPAPVPEWKGDDPRAKITLRQLLNMSSGLEFYEPYDPGSDSTNMLFQQHDMGAYGASKRLAHAPGTFWSYSSGTANLLSRIVFQKTGGTLASYEAYARAHLFDPAGIASAMFEPDETGNFVGSSYLYMTARDWARFGLLIANRGAINGHQVLPASFVEFMCTPAPAAPLKQYGGQFWLNGLSEKNRKVREFPHLPADMCAAEGHNDEFVAVFSSRKAVIVRLGWTVGGAEFHRDKHFAAILAALPK